MILQALTDYYSALLERGDIDRPGWSKVKVSYALQLSDDGDVLYSVDAREESERKGKTILVPRGIVLPSPVKRTVKPIPNFLCDTSAYILGVDDKGKPKRAFECFAACKELHETLLRDVDSPAARAVLGFFAKWDPEKAADCEAIKDNYAALISGANIIFRYSGGWVHEDPDVQAAWDRHYSGTGDEQTGVCLVTGEQAQIERIHPAIKNVVGAQSSGAALVSFNAPAFCSYGKEQNYNAPVGKYATFAYTSALNYLLADRDRVCRLGDTTIVFWAKNGSKAYQDMMNFAAFSVGSEKYSVETLQGLVNDLCAGNPVNFEEELLDPDMDFFILGLAPNAARLAVRFFRRNTFGAFLNNVRAHYERLKIVGLDRDPAPWMLLSETVNQNARDKSPSSELAGETVRSILNNTPYPATLLSGVILRMRAEHNITPRKAAIIKAYYIKKAEASGRDDPNIPKEVLQVSLNTQSTNVPYVLGRLFAILEDIQSAANPGINTTIRDKYFSSAAATPSVVFPSLIKLAQSHLKKLSGSKKGLAVTLDRQMEDLMGMLDTDFPKRLNLPQQGSFQLGYYHQKNYRVNNANNKEEN